MAKTTAETFRDRIVDFQRINVNELQPHPRNARLHPVRQRQAVKGLLTELGYVDAYIARKTPDGQLQILDGHLRHEETPDQEVPVLIVDLDEHEAETFLLTFDRTGEMAEWDIDMVTELLQKQPIENEDVKAAFDAKFLEKVLNAGEPKKEQQGPLFVPESMQGMAGGENPADPADPGAESEVDATGEPVRRGPDGEILGPLEERSPFVVTTDAIFPSSNKWGIPDLMPEMLAGEDCIPTGVYDKKPNPDADPPNENRLFIYGAYSSKDDTRGGVLAFYTHDENFENIWTDAHKIGVEKIMGGGWKAVMVPDFSKHMKAPLILQLYEEYRSRWCARFWQELEIKIIPHLSWTDERTWDVAFGTVPKGAPVVSTQCRSQGGGRYVRWTEANDEKRKWFYDGLRAAVETIQPKHFLIYGGAEHYDRLKPHLPEGPEYHFYYSFRTMIGNQRDAQVEKSLHKKGVTQ